MFGFKEINETKSEGLVLGYGKKEKSSYDLPLFAKDLKPSKNVTSFKDVDKPLFMNK